jgi:hypothetical protein
LSINNIYMSVIGINRYVLEDYDQESYDFFISIFENYRNHGKPKDYIYYRNHLGIDLFEYQSFNWDNPPLMSGLPCVRSIT